MLGADLTFAKDEETFAFAVLSAEDIEAGEHALAGRYVGGKVSASLGIGIGAAALVGGSNDNFALNPLAIEGNKGFGAAAGIGFLYINALGIRFGKKSDSCLRRRRPGRIELGTGVWRLSCLITI